MAQKALKRSDLILLCWAYHNSALRIGTIEGRRYTQRMLKIRTLDKDLLPIIQGIESGEGKLTALAVATSGLGGFASSRLIIATCNAYAWLHDIPIIELKSTWEHDTEKMHDRVAQLLGSDRSFRRQILPRYSAPPDITPARKKRKFTIASSA